MKTIEAIIERGKDGTFAVYCKDEIFSGMGTSIEEAKKDMAKQMEFYKKTAIEEGFKYPEFLDGEFRVEYTFDPLSLLQYYVDKGIFSLAGFSKVSGINQKQLWAYLHGTKPRKAQLQKMEDGFIAIKQDLAAIYA